MKTLGTSLRVLLAGILVVPVFFACQARQAGTQEQSGTAKSPAVAAIADTAQSGTATAPVAVNGKIIVYYFHGNMRCPTCHNLENYAKTEIEGTFTDAIRNGKLEWKTVNVETAGNEHFVKADTLYTKSVIVSTVKDGKGVSRKNLDRIWQLVREEAKYREYIAKEVRACLDGKCL